MRQAELIPSHAQTLFGSPLRGFRQSERIQTPEPESRLNAISNAFTPTSELVQGEFADMRSPDEISLTRSMQEPLYAPFHPDDHFMSNSSKRVLFPAAYGILAHY